MTLSDQKLAGIEAKILGNKPITRADKEALLAEVRERRPLPDPDRALFQDLRKGMNELRGAMGRGRTPAKVQAAVARIQGALDDYAA